MKSSAPQIVRKFLAGLASILLPCSIPAEDASSAPVIDDASAATESWFRDYFSPTEQGVLSFTTRTSNEIAQQGVDLTVPLRIAPDRSRALLSTLAFDHRDNGSNHFSMGLGYGFLIPDADIALRTRFHFDVGDTAFDNQVNRIAGGFDLFSGSGLDFIGNWYLPVSGADPAMRYYARPFAQSHSILQNFVGVDERGMRGGDLKIEFDVPGLESFLPTRAFVGGYHYDGKFAGDVEGFHGGITVHPSDSFFVGTEYYGDDEFFGDHWVFTAGMSMPLEGLFRADSWREQFRAVFSGGSDRARLTGSERLRSKMLGRVDRQNWVMTELSDPFTMWTDTLRDDVIFVNNGSAAGNGIAAGSGAAGAGTAEDPVSAIQTGAERLGALFNGRGIVYVQGGGPAYDSPLDTNIEVGHGAAPGVESVHFLSSFTGVVGAGGLALGGDTARPLIPAGGFDIRGGSFGATNMAKVEGFAIRGGITNDPPNVATPGSGISSLDVPTFHAADNSIWGSVSQGIVVYNDSVGSATARLSNNTVEGASSNGITILHVGSEGVDVLVTGNRLLNNGEEGFDLNLGLGTAPAGSRIEVSDNVVSANGFNGGKLIIDNTGSGPVTALVAGNRFLNNVEDGLDAIVGDDAIDLTVRDNRFSGNSSHGMDLTVDSDDGDSSNLVVTGNDFLDNTLNGLDLLLDVEDAGENTTLIESNLFARNGADGLKLDVDQDDAETVVITISGNQFLSNGDDSIELQSPGGDNLLRFRSTLDNVSSGAGSGLALRDSSTGGTEGELLINGNTVNFPNPGDVAD